MEVITGIYQDGQIRLDKELKTDRPVRVLITFLEEIEPAPSKRLTFSDFSFAKSRKALKDYKGSFTETLIEERRKAV